MSRKFFGTDGIRGLVNGGVMTVETAMRVGVSAGRYFMRGDHRHHVIIGKDTRLSGYMLEAALQAGFTAAGMDVTLLGPIPTPGVAMLTKSMRADLGVMISASHNPFHDNGIKLFGPDGYKLSDEAELEIEALMKEDMRAHFVKPHETGRVIRLDDVKGRYIEFAKRSFPAHLTLEGLKIVLDCANGAAYSVAPRILWELGATVIATGVEPNGVNINDGCGSTSPDRVCAQILSQGADFGIALDGDADRLIFCDEKGHIVDGDQLMALVAAFWQKQERLRGGGIVATVMSNLGLEHYLRGLGLSLARTQVGDRYVVEHMRAHGFNVGGEQSGHIVLSDFTTTGDGLLAALQIMGMIVEAGRPASEVCHRFDPYPQYLKNVRHNGSDPLASDRVKAVIADGEGRLGSAGRLVIRKSGTEPLIRVMGEGEDGKLVETVVDEICAAVETLS